MGPWKKESSFLMKNTASFSDSTRMSTFPFARCTEGGPISSACELKKEERGFKGLVKIRTDRGERMRERESNHVSLS